MVGMLEFKKKGESFEKNNHQIMCSINCDQEQYTKNGEKIMKHFCNL